MHIIFQMRRKHININCISILSIIKQMNINYQKHTNKILPSINNSELKHYNHQQKQKDGRAFMTKAERFHFQCKQTPGPGTYQSIVKDKHTSDYRVVKEQQKQGIAKEHQWILGNRRFQRPNNFNSNNIGPGMYNETNSFTPSPHSNWPKRQRFDTSSFVQTALGPGMYDPGVAKSPKKEKINQLSVFKSKSPKTFFQQMIMKEKKSIMKNPEESLEKQNQSGKLYIVKFDQTEYPASKKVSTNLSPVFNSKSQRPGLVQQTSSQYIGPGSYSQSLQFLQRPHRFISKFKGISSAIHYNLNASEIANRKSKLQQKMMPPGPGSYNLQYKLSQSSSKKAIIGTISKEERFKLKETPSSQRFPGPGQYMKNRFTMIRQEQIGSLQKKNSFIRKPEKSHDFGTVARVSIRNHNNVPFGQYNVHNFDVQYKILKQKEHLQKLRLMEVTLPAFNTKHK